MRIGLMLSYAEGFGQAVSELADCEAAGLDLVMVPEAYSFDAVSQLGYIAARTHRVQLASGVMQLFSRTPTLTAMTAAGLDFVSDGRFSLGLGTSGPQVVEGFHGVAFDAPVGRTREVVEICRRVWCREELTYAGRHYRIPLPAGEGTGLGKPLKLINRPVRDRIPILLGAVGPRNVELAAEIAEGWQPLFFHPERAKQAWGDALARGLARRPAELGPLDVMASAPVSFTDRPEPILARHRAMLALYIGGMGAQEKNFANDLVRRYGFVEEAETVQRLFLAGRREEAIAAVPEDLVRGTCLAGCAGEIRDRVAALADAGLTTLLVSPVAPTRAERLSAMEHLRAMN